MISFFPEDTAEVEVREEEHTVGRDTELLQQTFISSCFVMVKYFGYILFHIHKNLRK